MIVHEFGCVFVHIPKTGGVSISNILGIAKMDQRHTRLKDHKNYPRDYFKFCFVRNPWDRFVSCYSYFKGYGRGAKPDKHNGNIVNSFGGFEEFARSFSLESKNFRDSHFHNQTSFMDENMDFIGRFENLQEDFNYVCEKIGIPCQKVPHKNRSIHKHYTYYYDAETKKLVEDIYSKDIETFGYQFK